MPWKFVIVKVGNREVPIIFPDHMVHRHVADLLKHYYVSEAVALAPPGSLSVKAVDALYDTIVPVSAGSVNLDILVEPSSGSETLQLKARPGDNRLFRSYTYTGGVLPDEDERGGT